MDTKAGLSPLSRKNATNITERSRFSAQRTQAGVRWRTSELVHFYKKRLKVNTWLLKKMADTTTTVESIVGLTPISGTTATTSFQVTNLFVTWPQNELDKTDVLNLIVELYDPLWTIVASEEHADMNHHLHAAIKFVKRTRVYHDDLDRIGDKHGNYQKARNMTAVLKYCAKECDIAEYKISVKDYLLARDQRASVQGIAVMHELADGADLDQIVEEFPQYALNHKKVIQEWVDYYELKCIDAVEKEAWPYEHEDPLDIMVECAQDEIALWLTKNVKRPRQFKQKQLYVWGLTNLGKTNLRNKMAKYLKIYDMPKDGWMNGYKNELYDIVIFDEFEACDFRITWLNKFLEGSNQWLKVKFAVPYLKTDNPPILILSNYYLRETYSKVSTHILDTLRGRLEIVHITEYIDLFE